MEDPEVEGVEESVVESRPEEEKALLEEARKEAGVIDKVVEKVEEPAAESRPVEAVPDKVVEKSRPGRGSTRKVVEQLKRLLRL